MKKTLILGRAILGAAIVICSLNSCKNEAKAEDPKEVAEDQNEAKFEESDEKEDDSQFLVEAAETDMMEVAIGKLAQTKGVHPEVKKFGKMLEEDHSKAAAELKAFAAKKNISLPPALTEKGQDEYNKLNEKSGADFDKKFANMIVDAHEKAIKRMTKASENATDIEIKTWATNKVTSLTAHLGHAKMLKETVDK